MTMPTITVVTGWKDHPELERGYFDAVLNEDCQVICIDDGSQPPKPWGLRNETSQGFAQPNNLGLQLARTDAVLFLNSDVFAEARGWLEPIRAALEPGVLVGAELRTDPHGAVDGTPMPYLDGWCLAGTTQDLRDLGGWDETFEEPSYYGDNDLALRARIAGMTLREIRVPLCHLRNAGGLYTPDEKTRKATITNRERFVTRAREALACV
jgi:hypothetical protein